MSSLPAERTFFRGADGYEAARRGTVWNGLVPQRYPDVIVQAGDPGDVVAALRYARDHGHRVGVCSGGRSWTASHLRDGGLLLDVARLDHCDIDPDAMIARVGPGKAASAFALELDAAGLFFPAGHCEGIGLGGYLLQGGYGWNGKVLGPACESVLGLEVVTADGDTLHCDAEHHPDLYWAALGSGPGFFAVVTSFTVRIHKRPNVLGTCLYMYPIDVLDEVLRWGRTLELDDRVELQISITRGMPAAGLDQSIVTIASPVFADSEQEAVGALAPLGTCPVADRAITGLPYAPTTLENWYAAVMGGYPRGYRYAADNMFTGASADELLPGIRAIVETMPPHPSQLIVTGWKPAPHRAEMVYGLEDEVYIALYTAWQDPADDARYLEWTASAMAAMAHLSSGIALADENLARRPATFIAEPNMARLEKVRAIYDPEDRFHGWMG
ncbi:FAD-binding oxidoreductase [Mycobacterium sp. Marseille-P9652]|uniref:FAD-binding oxidoreductase n=1 Tax=Mycobacterium sp. Marseille-P9652 TaxID=2654950 RepID=UPI0012E86948|nr:FAD-binding oxidoreductase [Mycobacterium sp. Marseille-P9652]